MTQISRPFQIALAAIVLIALVWFVALRGHSSGGQSSGSATPSTSPTPAPASSSSASSASSPSSTGTSSGASAPGVNGLTRAIAKARGAVAQSEDNAKRLARKERQAANSAGSHSSHAPSTSAGSQPATKTAPPVAAKAAPTVAAAKARSGTAGASAKAQSGVPAGQTKVEGQLKQGKDVAILLWNPKGSVDSVVRRELQAAGRTFSGSLAVHVALASQVGSFGTFTRAVQVYSTPTILLIDPKGQTSSVTGLTDAFSIEQSVSELRAAH